MVQGSITRPIWETALCNWSVCCDWSMSYSACQKLNLNSNEGMGFIYISIQTWVLILWKHMQNEFSFTTQKNSIFLTHQQHIFKHFLASVTTTANEGQTSHCSQAAIEHLMLELCKFVNKHVLVCVKSNKRITQNSF